ncbi:MAG: hypothetical protein IKD83_01105 [Firmicutes bacterium]|nr:hypothetical protein [Bacillota bacterium]
MKKYVQAVVTIVIIIAIVFIAKTFAYKRVSVRSFIKTSSVERLWGEMGTYDKNGEFTVEKTFESEDIAGDIDKLSEYKLRETKGLVREEEEGLGEIRFYFYLNEYETDMLYVTEDGKAFTDVYTVKRSYVPHEDGMYEDVMNEFFGD